MSGSWLRHRPSRSRGAAGAARAPPGLSPEGSAAPRSWKREIHRCSSQPAFLEGSAGSRRPSHPGGVGWVRFPGKGFSRGFSSWELSTEGCVTPSSALELLALGFNP